jgi:DNA-binding transcriptional LysR family regulator
MSKKKAQVPAESGAAAADRIALLETFVRIVEAGSLSAAAPLLHTTQPTVSRRLRALEEALGVQLLQRTTHGMRLTTEGERCFERARVLLANWSAFEEDIGSAKAEPEGLLRVAVPHAFGQDKFVTPLAAFLRAHPRIDVDWLLMDDVSDALSRGIDCAIQVGDPRDPGVVAVRLAAVRRVVVGSPSLARRARIREPQALTRLPWLALRTYYRNELVLTHPGSGESRTIRIQPRFSTDSLYALRSAALHGLGVCAASAWVVADDIARGDLVQLAPEWQCAPLPIWITYTHAPHYPSRLLRFIAAMRAAVPPIVEG